MEIRNKKPEKGNKFYTRKASGGYSTCVKGKPTDECDVLSNCVGYACGRFNEIIGEMKYPSLNCNAENFIERAKNTYGLEVSDVPTLGGIMVWQKGSTLGSSDGAGHVAIVERIDSSNQIFTSESNYGGEAFFNSTRTNKNGRWGLSSNYKFRGCIVNPAIGKVTAPEKAEKDFFGGLKYFKDGDKHENIGKIAEFMRKTFPAYTSEKALGDYYGPYIKASIKEFQRRAKAEGNYNSTVDGYTGPITLASLKLYGFKE